MSDLESDTPQPGRFEIPGVNTNAAECAGCPEGLHRCGGCGGCVDLDVHDCPGGSDD